MNSNSNMLPPQTEMNKPKRGRGRPPGAKNRKTTRAQFCTSNANTAKNVITLVEVEKGSTEKELVDVTATNISVPMISSASTTEPCNKTIVVECLNNVHNKDAIIIKDCSIESPDMMVDLVGNSQFQDNSPVLQDHLNLELEQKSSAMPPQKISDAFSSLCWMQFLTEKANEPHLFEIFKDLLDSYRSKQIDTITLSVEITKHFHAYPDVIVWANNLVQEDSLVKTALHQEEYNGSNVLFLKNNDDDGSVETDVIQSLGNQQMKGVAVSSWYPNNNGTLVSVDRQDALMLSKEGRLQIPERANSISLLQPVDVFEAESLDDMTLLAINLLKNLQLRFIREPHKYEQVAGALSELYEMSEYLDSNMDVQSAVQLSEKRIRVYEVIRENLKEETDMLDVLEAFFTSERTYIGFPSCTTTESITKDISSTIEIGASVLNTKQSTSLQLELPVNEAEAESRNGDRSTLETSKMLLPCGLVVSRSKVDVSLMFSNVLLDTPTDQVSLNKIFESPSVTFEEKCRRWLQYQCDEQEWIDNLLFALDPILMRVTTLRKFMMYYLGSMLIKNTNNENVNEDSEPGEGETDQDLSSDKNVDIVQESMNLCQNDFDDLEKNNFSSGNYKAHADTSLLPKCSGRTELCNEVLNDTYYSAVSRRKKFWVNLRTNQEERLDDYEDARYEVDMMLYRNARSIELFEDLKYGMSKLENINMDQIQLDDSLGGSSVIHKHSVQLLYKNDGNLVIDRLQKFPVQFIPGVLRNMKVRDKEWIEMRARWNLLISSEVKNFLDKNRRQKTKRQKKKRA